MYGSRDLQWIVLPIKSLTSDSSCPMWVQASSFFPPFFTLLLFTGPHSIMEEFVLKCHLHKGCLDTLKTSATECVQITGFHFMSHLKENAPNATTLHTIEREQITSPCHTDSTTEANGLGNGGGNVSPPHIYTGKVKPIYSGEMRSLNRKLPKLINTILLLWMQSNSGLRTFCRHYLIKDQ